MKNWTSLALGLSLSSQRDQLVVPPTLLYRGPSPDIVRACELTTLFFGPEEFVYSDGPIHLPF